jgi:hypothetical protein
MNFHEKCIGYMAQWGREVPFMIILSKKILSGLAAFALLTIPAGASAREHRNTSYQSVLPHAAGRPAPATYNPPRGFAQPPLRVPPSRPRLGRPMTHTVPPPPVPAVHSMPPVPGPSWTNTDYDEDEAPPPRRWRSHHDRDDYPAQICDEDGDDCRSAPYRCDRDGDDCEYYREDYAPRGRGYGHQYDSGVPSYYNGRRDLLAERQQLIAQLDYAQAQFHAARASGDRKLSARWASYIKNLNHSLAAFDARTAGAAYNFPPYMAAPPPMQVQQYPYGGYPLAAYPNAGYPNATGYGVNSYGASPLSGVMGSLLGPMLRSGQIP